MASGKTTLLRANLAAANSAFFFSESCAICMVFISSYLDHSYLRG